MLGYLPLEVLFCVPSVLLVQVVRTSHENDAQWVAAKSDEGCQEGQERTGSVS